ncbi:hypothetical protein RGUI_1861 [Rhodovulum sp. P5]|nr:hypothetical protein RGUI_1861 [Rhodovulum sp. P5]
MEDLSLLAIPAMALLIAAALIGLSHRESRRNERRDHPAE